MKRITPRDLIDASEAVARITGKSHVFLAGLASTVHSIPKSGAVFTDDVDLFTPDVENSFVDEVIGEVGEGSPFEARHGFYVERLGNWVLLTQPAGWMERALQIPHPSLTIRVLHPVDLRYNKLETFRKKDAHAAARILHSGAVSEARIRTFIQDADIPPDTKASIVKNLEKVLATPVHLNERT